MAVMWRGTDQGSSSYVLTRCGTDQGGDGRAAGTALLICGAAAGPGGRGRAEGGLALLCVT